MIKPKVSVITITYNQEKYLEQTLDNILSQLSDFTLEVIVADDCSVDNTVGIIKKYQKNYPDIVKPIFRKHNIGSWNNFLNAIRSSVGDYIAICEGDDYWTDPTKLQRQVDFLEANKDYSICFHPVKVIYENHEEPESIFPKEKKGFSLKKLLEANYIQTNSVMYRAQNYTELANDVMPGDWYLHLFHAQYGKIGFIDREMSVYRKHKDGLWWDVRENIDQIWLKHGMGQLAVFDEALKMYGGETIYRKIICGSVDYLLAKFIDLDKQYKSRLFDGAIEKFPCLVKIYAEDQLSSIRELDRLRHEIAFDKKTQVDKLEQEINLMKSTKFWKMKILYDKIRHR